MSDKPWLIAAALLITAGLSACGSASQNDHAYDVADETRVSIEQGDLTGVRNLENKSRAWLGIPFASPPGGSWALPGMAAAAAAYWQTAGRLARAVVRSWQAVSVTEP